MKLKKIGFILLSLLFVFTTLPVVSSAARLSLRVELNGEKMSFPDAQPLVEATGCRYRYKSAINYAK